MIDVFSQLRSFTEVFGKLKKLDFTNGEIENHTDLLRSIWNGFRNRVEIGIAEQDTSEKLSIFIRYVQNNLLLFSNSIYQIFTSEKVNDNVHKLAELLRNIGVEAGVILDFLETNYNEYFDQNAPISLWKVYANSKANSQNSLIIRNFKQRNIDHELVEILEEHLGSLCNTNNTRIKDWRQFNYLTVLAERLLNFVQTPNEEDDTFRLIKLLIGYNFNPLAFYEYMLDFFERKAGNDLPYEDQEIEFLSLQKTIENIRPELKGGYDVDVPPISQSLSDCIRREISVIDRMKSVYFPNYQNSKKGTVSNFYFEVPVTLEELFLLNRVMVEVHFIKTRFKSNLYSFVERHIRTSRTKKPSAQYMRNIFGPNKEVPTRVVKKVRMWLAVMISFIDTNFKDQLKIWLLTLAFQEYIVDYFFV